MGRRPGQLAFYQLGELINNVNDPARITGSLLLRLKGEMVAALCRWFEISRTPVRRTALIGIHADLSKAPSRARASGAERARRMSPS
jgi:hypothetical protein